MNNNFYNLYFKERFKNFCLICGKNSNKICCETCNEIINTLEINNNKINFFKNYYYWMNGENKFGEKIMSYGLYCIKRLIPINTPDILKYIKKINLNQETEDNLEIQIFITNNRKITINIPKVKHDYEHFISYQNLFLYPELENNFSLHISN